MTSTTKSSVDDLSGRTATMPRRAVRPAINLLAVTSLLLLLDAALSLAWLPVAPDAMAEASRSAVEYVKAEALAESLWAAGGNVLAATAAALAAWWLFRNHAWGRTLGLALVTGFSFYRLTIVFDLLGELVYNALIPTWVSGLRILVAVAILPCLVTAGVFLFNRSLTRAQRHRALIGADDGPEPPAVKTVAYLLFIYGLTWVLMGLVAMAALVLWSGYDGNPRSLDFARVVMSGTLGCLGGVALLGAGLALWFGYAGRVTWQVTLSLAIVQFAGSVAMFLWESVPMPGMVLEVPGHGAQVVGQIVNGIFAVHALLLFVAITLLWSPSLTAYFRSRGRGIVRS